MGWLTATFLVISLLDLQGPTHGRREFLLKGTFAAFRLSLLKRRTAGTTLAIIKFEVLFLIFTIDVLPHRQLECLIEYSVDTVLLALRIDRLVDEGVSI